MASSIAPEGVDPIKVGIKHKGSASYIEQIKISSISAGSASYTEVNYWYEREEGYEYANNKTQHLWLWFYLVK